MDLKHIIEALRGGNNPGGPDLANIRRNADGSITKHPYSGGKQAGALMPTKLRGYQLHQQEAAQGMGDSKSYNDWLKDQ